MSSGTPPADAPLPRCQRLCPKRSARFRLVRAFNRQDSKRAKYATKHIFSAGRILHRLRHSDPTKFFSPTNEACLRSTHRFTRTNGREKSWRSWRSWRLLGNLGFGFGWYQRVTQGFCVALQGLDAVLLVFAFGYFGSVFDVLTTET